MEQINLNLIPGRAMPVCHVSQYDVDRTIRCNLFEGDTVFALATGDTAEVHVRKPDDTVVTASLTVVNAQTYLDIKTTQQMDAVAGSNLCEIQLTRSGATLGTLNFIMEVEADPMDGGAVGSQSEIRDLQAQVDAAIATDVPKLEAYMKYNVIDIFAGILANTTQKVNGVQFTWTNGVCDIDGTALSTSVNILRTSQAFPDGMVAGGTYFIKYATTDTKAQLRMIFRDANDTTLSTIYCTGDRTITVPSNAAKMTAALYVTTGSVLNHATVSEIACLNERTNGTIDGDLSTLAGKSFVDRDILANNTDLNTVTASGCYVLNSGNTYTNSPLGAGIAGNLLVFHCTNNTILQMVTKIASNSNEVYVRVSRLGAFTYAWSTIGAERGILPNNTDLDTVNVTSSKVLNSSYSYTNSPLASGTAGTLLVFKCTDNTTVQIVVGMFSGRMFVRSSYLGSFSNPWVEITGDSYTYNNTYTTEHYENTYNITCSPTITTDTNNYLASTGDNTDRTGDIQTMLNTTGYCHLGPGLFVVTGVEVPNYATLEGSGNRTTLRLDASVSDGYTVKLKTQSSIKNLRISGGTEVPALSDNIGSRNGVVFEGTRVPNDDTGTTYKRASIENCIIYFFSGSGILCAKTGTPLDSNMIISDTFVYSCGAGLNIAFYSEFHRISNCTFQYCFYGCIDNGGNNNFANCDFSGNRIGVLIDNSTDQSTNNSHGGFTNCTINHSISEAGVANEGTAIKLLKADKGEIFAGMQVFYGAIILDDCVGIRFSACNFGRKVPITITDSVVVTFTDCTFQQPPTDADATFTQSGNTVLKLTDCYLRSGTAYAPV